MGCFNSGLEQGLVQWWDDTGLVQWRTVAGSCSLVDCSRVMFRGRQEKGLFQWQTGTGSCSVADWQGSCSVADWKGSCSVADWSRGLSNGGLVQSLVGWRTGTGSCSAADKQVSYIHEFIALSALRVLLLCTLSLNTVIFSVTATSRKHSQLYPKLVVCSGRKTLIFHWRYVQKDTHTHTQTPLIISQRSISCWIIINT
jgi:hypothetical protein